MAAAAVDISALLAWEAANTPLPPSERLAEECQACARALDAALQSDGLLRLRFAKDGEGRPTRDTQCRGREVETRPEGGESREGKEGSSSASAVSLQSAVDGHVETNGGAAVCSGEMMYAARSLFALSAEEKQAAAADVEQRPGFVRGYLGMGAESGLAAMHEPKVRR